MPSGKSNTRTAGPAGILSAGNSLPAPALRSLHGQQVVSTSSCKAPTAPYGINGGTARRGPAGNPSAGSSPRHLRRRGASRRLQLMTSMSLCAAVTELSGRRCLTRTGWSTWTSLGGQVAPNTGPGVDEALHLFVQGTDNQLWFKSAYGAGTAWRTLGGAPPEALSTSSPGAGLRPDDHSVVCVSSTSGTVWYSTISLTGSGTHGPRGQSPKSSAVADADMSQQKATKGKERPRNMRRCIFLFSQMSSEHFSKKCIAPLRFLSSRRPRLRMNVIN